MKPGLILEKKNIFFGGFPRMCRICHKPKVRRNINLNDFNNNHKNMIYIGHGGVLHAIPPAAAGVPAAYPNFVTRAE